MSPRVLALCTSQDFVWFTLCLPAAPGVGPRGRKVPVRLGDSYFRFYNISSDIVSSHCNSLFVELTGFWFPLTDP